MIRGFSKNKSKCFKMRSRMPTELSWRLNFSTKFNRSSIVNCNGVSYNTVIPVEINNYEEVLP